MSTSEGSVQASTLDHSAAGCFSQPFYIAGLVRSGVGYFQIATDISRIWTKALDLQFLYFLGCPCFGEPRCLTQPPLAGCPCLVERRGAKGCH